PKIDRQGGKGIKIVYSTVKCDLGHLLVATTEQGICAVKLGDRSVELTETLKQEFFGANLIQDDNQHRDWIEQILQTIAGHRLLRAEPSAQSLAKQDDGALAPQTTEPAVTVGHNCFFSIRP
ncbi:MAG: hypothetical protein AAFQ23_15695, partial [Cyanobacteria bacterium J06623_1]